MRPFLQVSGRSLQIFLHEMMRDGQNEINSTRILIVVLGDSTWFFRDHTLRS